MNKQGPKTYNIYVRRNMDSKRLHLRPVPCEREFTVEGERCFVHHTHLWGGVSALEYSASHVRTGLAIEHYAGTVEEAIERAKKRIAENTSGFRRGVAISLKARKPANPIARASSNGRTSAFQADDPGSSPGARSINPKGGKA